MSAPLYKIKQKVENTDSRVSKQLLKLRRNSWRTLITILIGNNLINVILTIYASGIWESILANVAFASGVSFMIISITITTLLLIFGEIIPKVFATKFALKYALVVTPLIDFCWKILFPVIVVFDGITKLLNKSLAVNDEKVSREDVETFVNEGKKQWIFSSVESMIIKNLFTFNERSVDTSIKHRTEMFALSSDIQLKDAIKKVLQLPYSRVPVFEHDKDNIIGIINIRDLLSYCSETQKSELTLGQLKLRPVFKLPVTANVFDVFLRMKKTWQHFAVVVDEHGGTEWIVTFEDILEDMVWDIKDESDFDEEHNIVKVWVNELIVRWDVVLRDILNSFGIKNFHIPEELSDKLSENDMISYIILTMLKSFAKKGEIVKLWELKFEVIKVNEGEDKIEKVKVSYSSASNKSEK